MKRVINTPRCNHHILLWRNQNVSSVAAEKMKMINHCNQDVAKVMMFDETFPKAKDKGCINIGVVTCENGLIRKVGVIDISKKSKSFLLK